jgi:hypothetical protein
MAAGGVVSKKRTVDFSGSFRFFVLALWQPSRRASRFLFLAFFEPFIELIGYPFIRFIFRRETLDVFVEAVRPPRGHPPLPAGVASNLHGWNGHACDFFRAETVLLARPGPACVGALAPPAFFCPSLNCSALRVPGVGFEGIRPPCFNR